MSAHYTAASRRILNDLARFQQKICRKLKRPGENGIQICRSLRLEGLDAPLHLVIPD